jgi:hypothetical protein
METANPFRVEIPHVNLGGGGADMRTRLQTWQWRNRLPAGRNELELDFTENRFIEPWALAFFTAYALRMKQNEANVVVRLSAANPANVYVGQMGLRHVINTGTSTPDWDGSAQNTGLHVIRTHSDVTRFVNSASQLGVGPSDETIDALRYGMAELGRNVVQHSASAFGGVAIAQFFPERRAIQISICDCGQGVLAALSRTYPELKNDGESLKLAVLPHVSGAFRTGTYSASENAGLGLFFSKEICWRSGGSFWLVSGGALLGIRGSDASGRDRIYRRIERWEGTSVTMDLPAKGVIDFSGLLHVCRTLAAQARDNAGPAGLDFLNEIPDVTGLQVIDVGGFVEDVEEARHVRTELILPAIARGDLVILNFAGARFATQSFVHALLNDAFRVPGSLCRLSFVNCTSSTEEAIRAVAAYAASYEQCV